MEKHIVENAGDAVKFKSLKKYLKYMIEVRRIYIENAMFKPHTYPNSEIAEAEYNILNDILDAHIYFKELSKLKQRTNNDTRH